MTSCWPVDREAKGVSNFQAFPEGKACAPPSHSLPPAACSVDEVASRYACFGGGSRAVMWKASGRLVDLEKLSHETSPGDE